MATAKNTIVEQDNDRIQANIVISDTCILSITRSKKELDEQYGKPTADLALLPEGCISTCEKIEIEVEAVYAFLNEGRDDDGRFEDYGWFEKVDECKAWFEMIKALFSYVWIDLIDENWLEKNGKNYAIRRVLEDLSPEIPICISGVSAIQLLKSLKDPSAPFEFYYSE